MKWWLRWRLRVWERRMLIARGRMETVYKDSYLYDVHMNEYATALGAVDYFRRKLDPPFTTSGSKS